MLLLLRANVYTDKFDSKEGGKEQDDDDLGLEELDDEVSSVEDGCSDDEEDPMEVES